MTEEILARLTKEVPVVADLRAAQETVWCNPGLLPFEKAKESLPLTMADINDAEARLARFAPFLMARFPETEERQGIIESVLTPVPRLRLRMNERDASKLTGKLFLKQDSHLAIAGSVKARGGIYEILHHTEELAFANGLLSGPEDDYTKLATEEARDFFRGYTVQVGSTGNLGLSIGIISAAVGFEVIVHMSADARQWKKDLLRQHGVTVVEYEADYGEAVKNGRRLSDENPRSYFVDDENSRHLFLGYAVAAKRLAGQLAEKKVQVDGDHPLFLYIPCGVGGAPGGVAFGAKQVFGDNVHVFFAEPVQAPCMLAGMATGLHSDVCVQDLGLTGMTHADGLAVARPSGFVGRVMEPLLSGEYTVEDYRLYNYMRDLLETEGIFIEPSACAAFRGPEVLMKSGETRAYLEAHGLMEKMENAAHILWATGGSLVPKEVRLSYVKTHL